MKTPRYARSHVRPSGAVPSSRISCLLWRLRMFKCLGSRCSGRTSTLRVCFAHNPNVRLMQCALSIFIYCIKTKFHLVCDMQSCVRSLCCILYAYYTHTHIGNKLVILYCMRYNVHLPAHKLGHQLEFPRSGVPHSEPEFATFGHRPKPSCANLYCGN